MRLGSGTTRGLWGRESRSGLFGLPCLEGCALLYGEVCCGLSNYGGNMADRVHVGDRIVITSWDLPPIPCRLWDWSAVLEGYEPGDYIGRGVSEEAAIEDLLEQVEDL